jgi:hypothetical protein
MSPIDTEASKAIFNRIWSHTLGIVNENATERVVGKLPDGRRVESNQHCPAGQGATFFAFGSELWLFQSFGCLRCQPVES